MGSQDYTVHTRPDGGLRALDFTDGDKAREYRISGSFRKDPAANKAYFRIPQSAFGNPRTVAFHGLAYLADRDGGIITVDFTDPGAPLRLR